jgi:hypothetical protein
MKDLVITARSVRRELLVLAGCLLLALLINAAAIVAYRTRWIELLTTWRVTLGLALALFVTLAVLRLAWAGVRWSLRTVRRQAASPPSETAP